MALRLPRKMTTDAHGYDTVQIVNGVWIVDPRNHIKLKNTLVFLCGTHHTQGDHESELRNYRYKANPR